METLVDAGWDARGWEELFASGAVLTPEAQLERDGPSGLARVGLAVADQAVSFEWIGADGSIVSATLFPDHIAPLLAELVRRQDDLDDETVADFLIASVPRCRAVLLDTPDGPVSVTL